MRSRLIILLLAAGGLALTMPAFVRSMVYPAPAVRVPSPAPPPLTEIFLDLGTGDRATAWFSNAAAESGAPLAIFFHGNGENLETMRRGGLFEALDGLGIAHLAVDYPGYGRSGGRPSEESLAATGDAAVAWALEHHRDRPLAVCGWSLGAAVAIPLAARHGDRVAGLVALSPWTSLPDVARRHFPGFVVQMALSERYDSRAAAREVHLPALVMHGERDAIIPAEQGEAVAAALPESTRWVRVPRAGHNDLLGQEIVWRELKLFFDALAR